MNITKTNSLSFYNEQGILTLNAKQFDTGRMFVFHIMHNDVPFDLSGCAAYLRIAKADGTQFQGHECCTIEGSKVIIKTNIGNGSQILTAAGTNACELHLEDSDGTSLTTWTFHIVVEPRVHDGSHMSSIDSYDVLDNMINMEKERIANEEQRKENEANRNTVFEQKIEETNAVITDCRLVIDAANQKISSFDAEINEIVDGITDEAQSYADNAKESETNAANAASSAADSAATALQKAGDAAASAVLSQSYAVGGTQSRAGEDVDNAKYYSEKSQETLQKLQETTVTSIKGNAESAYRTGDVNITPDNIGLGNVNNTSDENKPVSNAQRTAIDAKVSKSGDTMTGPLNFANAIWNVVGDDVAIGDMNVAGTLCLKGLNGYPGIRLMDSAENVVGEVVHTGAFSSLRKYTIDLSGQSSSNFYFIEFSGAALNMAIDCEIRSNLRLSGEPFNCNYVKFQYVSGGWSDVPSHLEILNHSTHDSSEICIMSIVRGYKSGHAGIYVRGDNRYDILCNYQPVLHISGVTLYDEYFPSGNTTCYYTGFDGAGIDVNFNENRTNFSLLNTEIRAPLFNGPASSIRDCGDGRTLTFNYSADGLDDPTWLAAWNGNELRGVAASKYKGGGSGDIYRYSYRHNFTDENRDYPDNSFDYDCIQFNNGVMLLVGFLYGHQSVSQTITFPISFVNNKYVVVSSNIPIEYAHAKVFDHKYITERHTGSSLGSVKYIDVYRVSGYMRLTRTSGCYISQTYDEWGNKSLSFIAMGRWK